MLEPAELDDGELGRPFSSTPLEFSFFKLVLIDSDDLSFGYV
jgi:hypothetical protein